MIRSGIQRRHPPQPTTPKLVSKHIPVPTEPVELTAFLRTLEFEGKFSPGFQAPLTVFSALWALLRVCFKILSFLRLLIWTLFRLLFGTRLFPIATVLSRNFSLCSKEKPLRNGIPSHPNALRLLCPVWDPGWFFWHTSN